MEGMPYLVNYKYSVKEELKIPISALDNDYPDRALVELRSNGNNIFSRDKTCVLSFRSRWHFAINDIPEHVVVITRIRFIYRHNQTHDLCL